MRRSVVLGGGAVLVAGVLAYLLVFKRTPPAEELIRQKAVQMAYAAERKDVGFIVDQLSMRFRTEEGGLDRDAIRGLLLREVMRGQWLRVFTADLDVKVLTPTSAEFSGKFIFGRSEAKLLKDLAKESVLSAYRIDGVLEREEDGEWRFVSARYRQLDPGELY